MSFACHISMINYPFFDFPAIKSLPTSLWLWVYAQQKRISFAAAFVAVHFISIKIWSQSIFSRWTNHTYAQSIGAEVLFACMRLLARDKIANWFAVICACKIRANYKNYQLVANISRFHSFTFKSNAFCFLAFLSVFFLSSQSDLIASIILTYLTSAEFFFVHIFHKKSSMISCCKINGI